MKVAIVHDYIKEQGGAEVVLEELLKIYPQADVYTSIYVPEALGPHKKRYENANIRTSFLNSIPGRSKLISPLRILSPFAFKSFDLRKYDVVIVSQTGAYFPNLVKHKNPSARSGRAAKLICYTHTPPRYLYGYTTARDWKKNKFSLVVGTISNHFLRMVDFSSSQNVDLFIANSEEVAKRIEKFYRKSATVIYPPVKIPNVVRGKKEDFYLTGGRLARAKGIDVIIKAFNKNGKKLKIFGKGFAGYDEKLKSLAHKNIEFVGEVSDDEKFELMARAKAFVFASFDEDFGITPVESMGVGTPVIAFRSGGVKETVVDGKTGVFYEENTPEKLNLAILELEKISDKVRDDMEKECIKQAEKFSPEVFDKKIKEVVGSA